MSVWSDLGILHLAAVSDVVSEFASKKKNKEGVRDQVKGAVVEGRQDWSVIQTGGEISRDTVTSYIRSAEYGDWTYLHTFYDEMRARDAGIETKLSLAERVVSGASIDVLPYPASTGHASIDSEANSAQSIEIAAWVENVLKSPRTRIDRAINALMGGFWKGLGALEVITAPGVDGKERIESLEPIPSQRFRYAPNSMDLMLQTGSDRSKLTDVRTFGSQLVIFQPEDHVWNPARRGLLRRAIGHFLIRVYVPAWWARGAELFFTPTRIGKYPKGDQQTRDLMVQAMEDAGSHLHLAIPAEADIIFAEAKDRGVPPHEAFLDWTDDELSKLILGATQMVDVKKGTGSISSTTVHQETMMTIARARAREIASCLREQLIYPLVYKNFGEEAADAHTPEIVIRVGQDPDLLHMAVAIKTIVDAGGGEAVPLAVIHERGYVRKPGEGEKTFPKPGVARGATAPQQDDDEDQQGPGQKKKAPPQFGAPPYGVDGEQKMSSGFTSTSDALAQMQLPENDILAPYRELVDAALDEGASIRQLFARMIGMTGIDPASQHMIDVLAALQTEMALRGYERTQ